MSHKKYYIFPDLPTNRGTDNQGFEPWNERLSPLLPQQGSAINHTLPIVQKSILNLIIKVFKSFYSFNNKIIKLNIKKVDNLHYLN